MPRTMRYWAGLAAAAAALGWAAWPGTPDNPATLISRVDVIATVLILAGIPLIVRRKFGPGGSERLPRLLRTAGYAAVFALILVKADVERLEMARFSGISLAGLWAGEVVFLLVIAAYVAALLAVTAQRPPAGPATLAIGTGVGLLLGLAIFVLRPLANHVHIANRWLADLYDLGIAAAVLLVLYAAIRAAIAAARRTSRRDSKMPISDARARQGFAAGLCIGIAAALLVSVLGITTIALVPRAAGSIQWTLPNHVFDPGRGRPHTPDYVTDFEVSFSQAAAGYLLVLILFPVLGAGLGAWGGLFAAGDSGQLPGGGGGGGRGPQDPDPEPGPPGGGRSLLPGRDPAFDLAFPDWDELEEFPELGFSGPDRVPAGLPG
ncbi:MAG TPA: hypothetical protein VGH53_12980 [Streptosporangiaceae bacterium]